MHLFLAILIFLFTASSSHAEPWMANRFANNCAACHAPGRFNLEVKERRCTLSCQGCHTNPNGGGLRSFYGKWNSQRWMKSFHSKKLKNKEQPLPWFAQSYTKEKYAQDMKRAILGTGKNKIHQKTMPKSERDKKYITHSINQTKKLRARKNKDTNTLSDFPKYSFNDLFYRRENGDNNWDIEAQKASFLTTIPKDDPYRLKRKNMLNVGADFRFLGTIPSSKQTTSSSTVTKNSTDSAFWPMALNIGLEFRPQPNNELLRHIALVNEFVYLNGPTTPDVEELFTGSTRTKSSYILVDELPYNSFIMHGYYRPMFDYYTPDHTSLAQKIFHGNAYTSLYKTTSFGTNPNVPFFNIHMIQAFQNTSFSQDEGLAFNVGARWITWGASLVYSYWSTKDTSTPDKLSKIGHSLQLGMMWKKLIANFEWLRLENEFAASKFDKGNVITLETRYRLWKESYLEFILETANMAINKKEGSATQYSLGYKIYTFPGMEFSAAYKIYTDDNKNSNIKTESSGVIMQAHLYF